MSPGLEIGSPTSLGDVAHCDRGADRNGSRADDVEGFPDRSTEHEADGGRGEADGAGDGVDRGAHLGREERSGGRGGVAGGLGDRLRGEVGGDDGSGVSDGGLLLLGGGWLLAAFAAHSVFIHRINGNVVLLDLVHLSILPLF